MRSQWEGFREYLFKKQERLNKEKQELLTKTASPEASALERSNAVDRLQQIDRLQNSIAPVQFLTFLHYQNSSASRSFAEKAASILAAQGFRVFPPTAFKSGETLKGSPYVSYFLEPGSRLEQQEEARRAAERVAELLTEAGKAENIGPFITKPHFDIPGQSRNLGVWF